MWHHGSPVEKNLYQYHEKLILTQVKKFISSTQNSLINSPPIFDGGLVCLAKTEKFPSSLCLSHRTVLFRYAENLSTSGALSPFLHCVLPPPFVLQRSYVSTRSQSKLLSFCKRIAEIQLSPMTSSPYFLAASSITLSSCIKSSPAFHQQRDELCSFKNRPQ